MATYPFNKRVRPARLQEELRAALGVDLVAYVNGSEEPPYAGLIGTTRDLTPEEQVIGLAVVQAHDWTDPEGDALTWRQLRPLALPLVGRTFQSLTLAELKVVAAVLAHLAGCLAPGGVLRIPAQE